MSPNRTSSARSSSAPRRSPSSSTSGPSGAGRAACSDRSSRRPRARARARSSWPRSTPTPTRGSPASSTSRASPRARAGKFSARLVPSEADGLVAAGDEASLRRALELEPTRSDAAVALAKLLHARGERDEAAKLLQNVAGDFGGEGLAARIRLEDQDAIDLDEAFAALDAGDRERALDLLVGAIPSADGHKDDVRRVVVAILDELGVEDPLARDARRR